MPLKSATPRRNKYAPRADQLIFCAGLGGLSEITNLATAAGKLPDATLAGSVTSTTDANGGYLDFASTSGADVPMAIADPGGTADLIVPRCTVMVEFSNVGDSSTNRPIFTSDVTSSLSSTHGMVLAQFIADGTNTIRLSVRDHLNSLTRQYDFVGVSRSDKHVLIMSLGPSGFEAWLDGADPTSSSSSPTAYTGGMRTVDAHSIAWGRNTAGELSLMRLHNTALWKCNLTSEERDELFYDAALCCREPAGLDAELGDAAARADDDYEVGDVVAFATGDYLYECTQAGNTGASDPTGATYETQTVSDGTAVWTARVPSLFIGWAGPTWVGRPTTSTISFQNCTSRWMQSASAYWRVKVATTKSGVDGATPVTSGQLTVGETASTLTKTGLTADTTYYWQAEWSTDNSTWYPFPCGIGTFKTMGSADPTFQTLSDDHINVGTGGICPSDIGQGDDIALDANAYTINEAIAYRNRYSAYRTANDMCGQTAPHFLVWCGDHFMFDSDATAGTAADDYTSDKWQRARSTTTFYCRLIKRQANFLVLGNHEGEGGIYQEVDGGNKATQKQSFNTRIAVVCNPTSATYAQGGEAHNSSADWIWPTSQGSDYIGPTDVDLENYYAFKWGNTLFFFLDTWRYAGIDETTEPYFEAPSSVNIGATQFAWLRALLAGNSNAIKIGFGHSLFGGIFAGQTSGDDVYARGSGLDINQAEPYATQAVVEGPDERSVHALFRRYGVTAYVKGHDHKYDLARINGVYYITLPTGGAPSHTQGAAPGWHWTEIRDSYGKAEDLGQTDDSGDSLTGKGQIIHYNTLGYVTFVISSGALSHSLRITGYFTSGTNNSETDPVKFHQQFDSTLSVGYAERWISDVAHTPSNSGNLNDVTLATGDSLNASPAPVTVYGAYLSSAITGTWWTAALSQKLGQLNATAWAANTAYSAGDHVYPLAKKTGYLYRCTTAGTSHATTEPTFSGASTDWPTSVGGTVTNGTAVFTCVQVFDQDRPYSLRLPAGATISVTTSSAVKVAYAPRTAYSQSLTLKTPEFSAPSSGAALAIAIGGISGYSLLGE